MFLFSHRSTSCSSLGGREGCLDIKGPKEREIGRVLLGVYVLKWFFRAGRHYLDSALCVWWFSRLGLLDHRLLVFAKKTLFLARDKIDLSRKHFIPLKLPLVISVILDVSSNQRQPNNKIPGGSVFSLLVFGFHYRRVIIIHHHRRQ
jgi:hypothetical protein